MRAKLADPFAGPMVRTLAGCRRRVELMSLGARWKLCYEFKIDEADLPRLLYRQAKSKRRFGKG